MSSIRNTDYFARLVRQNKRIWRIPELALLWNMKNKLSLYTTLRRYQKRGLLYKLTAGLYSFLPFEKLDPLEVGVTAAGSLAYVSTETVLVKAGVISQTINRITLVGKKRKEWRIQDQEYLCRYLNPKYLVNREGIIPATGYDIASDLRAAADLRHILPYYHFDGLRLLNKKQLITIERTVGYR